ncbi:hypothetical protein [Chryseobacterium sp.]|uniref:hypothetical protein n=1 Tax=Chryseobacterium sp. TaxID=1871047 RepID=UPI000ED498C1|nr:hypothetical protein [Chryseobacterium sp.]HCM33824.1 hypothetical protein [Chryseobacterium sp.]
MINSAAGFKSGSNRVIESHVRKILQYVVSCYQIILKDGKKYNYSTRGKIKQENFLRNGLVDDYLRKNINLLNSNGINQYTIINRESTETYHSESDGLIHDDPIDIKIEYPPLKNDLQDDSVYFAIECKRITIDSDSKDYVLDTEKFSDRVYTSKRLPFEGQIGFIENSKISHDTICVKVNERLQSCEKLTTTQKLKLVQISPDFEGSYKSMHKKINDNKDDFSVFHLFLDYSKIVVTN